MCIIVCPWLPLFAPSNHWFIDFAVHFWSIQSLKGASSFVTLGWTIICDRRTENHNFTITTNTSQHVEFFHSLIFKKYWCTQKKFTQISGCTYSAIHKAAGLMAHGFFFASVPFLPVPSFRVRSCMSLPPDAKSQNLSCEIPVPGPFQP